MQCCGTAQPRLSLVQQQQRGVRAVAFRSRRCSSTNTSRCTPSSSSSKPIAPRQNQGASSRPGRQLAVTCRAADDRPPASSSVAVKFNPVYLVITGAYAALLVFKNPYIYAVLTIVTILPQNSNVTSLNNLVLLFYESGLFQNFAEAVNCVRLVTWLSMGFMVASFAVFK